MSKVCLRGMTWDHSRGFDPMVATAQAFSVAHPEVEIVWEKRSLQAFADRPIEDMAGDYDLMVIDHPHLGEVARKGNLLPFDGQGYDEQLATLSEQSVGLSHLSYQFDNRQWALAIDAATPVAAFRDGALTEVPKDWSEVLELARQGEVGFALIPINALMTYFGLAKNKGYAVAEDECLMHPDQSEEILELMREAVALINQRCLQLDPIGIYDWMSQTQDAPSYSPFGYGYTNYSRQGYCPYSLTFTDAPGIDGNGPEGTVLGGTGIAISSQCEYRQTAFDYCFLVAGAQWQQGVFFESGGQPANALAWQNEDSNRATGNFFRNTRRTLESAWLRPRYDGYMGFQDAAGEIVHACLRGDTSVATTTYRLQQAYERSRDA